MNEKQQQLNKLAHDVLILSRNTLLVNLRFLDAAISRITPLATPLDTIATDGEHLFYNPKHILKCYAEEKERTVRDYLHILLHCVFKHMFVEPTVSRAVWDLAADIAVENAINDLAQKSAEAKREAAQKGFISSLLQDTKLLSAEKIYRILLDNNMTAEEIAYLRASFLADEHDVWYMPPDEVAALYGLSSGENENGEGTSFTVRAELSADWQTVSERMQTDLETFSKQQGDKAGNFMQNLAAVTREKYDYTAFLKKFATLGEVMKINDDEFDYLFYTYGLELYDKMPLIEPLEYKEVKRIKEFVIAIDTSGSTSGELVQKFVQKTYNILKSTESFFSKINLHIVQCDALIQDVVKITSQEEFDAYLKNMKIHGLGGTDFRPVFTYVDELIKLGEFTNLKGLIYFTDGYGDFPAKKPDYDTAFVFVDDEYNNPDVPPWAIKLVLPSDEI